MEACGCKRAAEAGGSKEKRDYGITRLRVGVGVEACQNTWFLPLRRIGELISFTDKKKSIPDY